MVRHSFLFILFITLGFSTWAEGTIYLTPEEALKITFKNSGEVISEKKTLSFSQQEQIEKKLGYSLSKNQWNFYIARSGGKIEGYAVIDHEVGKTEPITFLTAILPTGEVSQVEILAYRESHGGEVREKRFLNQFKNKNEKNPLRVGQDLANIAGATLSSRAVSRGVKRALSLWYLFYGTNH